MNAFPKNLTVVEAAESRRSIRKYTDDPIPDSHVDEILRIASLAPSPWNLQPWRVIVVSDPEIKLRLQEAAYGQTQVGDSQVLFVVTTDMKDALSHIDEIVHPNMVGERREKEIATISGYFGQFDAATQEKWARQIGYIFVGYLLLAVQSMGYSSSPMLGFVPDKVKEVLGLEAHVEIPALLAVGVAAEEGFPHHRHPLDRFVRKV